MKQGQGAFCLPATKRGECLPKGVESLGRFTATLCIVKSRFRTPVSAGQPPRIMRQADADEHVEIIGLHPHSTIPLHAII
jgi:hypothetical protein